MDCFFQIDLHHGSFVVLCLGISSFVPLGGATFLTTPALFLAGAISAFDLGLATRCASTTFDKFTCGSFRS
ncbi:hypothetical protein BDE02_04G175700 [Populus trichocarpa]|nr:hypothetical protein BDE02_04G175700 [Populus trichocarpa]